MINPGQLNRRISIERPATGLDDFGQPLTTWFPFANIWADIRAPRGLTVAERITSDRQAAPATYSVRIRWLDGITSDMRVLIGTEVLQIAQVVYDHAGREYVDLACVAGVS